MASEVTNVPTDTTGINSCVNRSITGETNIQYNSRINNFSLISAHGRSTGKTFIVPNGYNFITFGKVGKTVSDKEFRQVWSFLFEKENMDFLDELVKVENGNYKSND